MSRTTVPKGESRGGSRREGKRETERQREGRKMGRRRGERSCRRDQDPSYNTKVHNFTEKTWYLEKGIDRELETDDYQTMVFYFRMLVELHFPQCVNKN